MIRSAPNRVPGLIVGGTGSNAGKTVTTLALLCALQARGLRVHAAKTGPDFIDTAFHAALTGAPAANLDVWMCRASRPNRAGEPLRRIPQGLARIFARMRAPGMDGRAPDILVVEGAMGLYDGGAGGSGCTAQLAALLGLPCCWCSMPTAWASPWPPWRKAFCAIARPGAQARDNPPLPE